MFKCENETCGKQQPPGQPVNYITIEQRRKVYKKEIYKNHRREKLIDIVDVIGSEIVKELKVCPACFRTLTGKEPRLQMQAKETPKRTQGFNRQPPRRKWKNPRLRGPESRGVSRASTASSKKPIVEKVSVVHTGEKKSIKI